MYIDITRYPGQINSSECMGTKLNLIVLVSFQHSITRGSDTAFCRLSSIRRHSKRKVSCARYAHHNIVTMFDVCPRNSPIVPFVSTEGKKSRPWGNKQQSSSNSLLSLGCVAQLCTALFRSVTMDIIFNIVLSWV